MDIDHEYTDDIVCPWCGHTWQDSGEWSWDYKDTVSDDCGECGKPFEARREFAVYYTTIKGTE